MVWWEKGKLVFSWETAATSGLQFSHLFNQYLLRNYYVPDTGESGRYTMVNKSWSLVSGRLGSS